MLSGERRFVLPLTCLLIIGSLLAPGDAAGIAVVFAAALTWLAWTRRVVGAVSLGVLFLTCFALLIAGLGPQQLVFVLAFAVYGIVVSRVPWLGDATRWLTVGRVELRILAAGVAFAVVSAVALLVWYVIARPDLSDLVKTFAPDWPLSLLAPAAFVLALVNAAVEEAAYRGVVLDALDRALGTSVAALLLQAVAFAALHFQSGFPRGLVGLGLTFIYGLALGMLRRAAGGLMVPFLTHVLTDVAIFTIVLSLART
jgi:membrane protease YdiL (CAAX protease family)